MGYTAFRLLTIEMPYFFVHCRPFSQYWAMLVSNPQCANYFYYCTVRVYMVWGIRESSTVVYVANIMC